MATNGKPLRLRARRDLVRAVEASVAAVADDIRRARVRLRPADVRKKDVGDIVTAVDLRVERALRRQLLALLPDAGFLGEETAAAGLERELVWVVDPIDGTSNFARGLAHHAVAVALLERGDPTLAVVHCEPEGALYTALRGAGARRAGRRIRMPRGRLDAAAILGCQWHRGQQQLDFLARLQSRGSRIRTLGCTVTQLVDVAMGRLDANVQEQGRIWDFAAAALVVEEAGGRITDWEGRAVFPLSDLRVGHIPTVAASPGVHGRVLALLRGAGS